MTRVGIVKLCDIFPSHDSRVLVSGLSISLIEESFDPSSALGSRSDHHYLLVLHPFLLRILLDRCYPEFKLGNRTSATSHSLDCSGFLMVSVQTSRVA